MNIFKTNTTNTLKPSFCKLLKPNLRGMNEKEIKALKIATPKLEKIADVFDLKIAKGIRVVDELTQKELATFFYSKKAMAQAEEVKAEHYGLAEIQSNYVLFPTKANISFITRLRQKFKIPELAFISDTTKNGTQKELVEMIIDTAEEIKKLFLNTGDK